MLKKFIFFLKNNIFRFISFILIFFCLFTSISTINKKKASASGSLVLSYGLYEVVIYLLGAIGVTGVATGLSELEYSLLVEHMVKWVSVDGRLTPYFLIDATKAIILGRDLQKYCPDFIKDFIKECMAFNGFEYSSVQEIDFDKKLSFSLSPCKSDVYVSHARDIFYFENTSTHDININLDVSSDLYYKWLDPDMTTPLSDFSYSLNKTIPARCKFTGYVRYTHCSYGYYTPKVVLVNYNMDTGECMSDSTAQFDSTDPNIAFNCRLFGSNSFYAGTFDLKVTGSSLSDLYGSICVDGVINLPKVNEDIGEDVLPYLDADSISISNSNVNANELVADNANATDIANELGYSGTLGLSDSLANESEIDKADTKEIELPGEDNINKDDYSTPKKIKLNFSPLYLNLKDKFPFCLPWDLKNLVKSLVSEKECPKFVIDFSVAGNHLVGSKNSKFDIDFNKFDKIINILRYFELLCFVLFLIKKTNNLLGRG